MVPLVGDSIMSKDKTLDKIFKDIEARCKALRIAEGRDTEDADIRCKQILKDVKRRCKKLKESENKNLTLD